MTRAKNLTGQRFGMLTVIGLSKEQNLPRKKIHDCICDCGNTKRVTTTALCTGNTISCGCFKKTQIGIKTTKHGLTNTREYEIWNHIKDRCSNPNAKSFKDYGARGITVCERWQNSFENFYTDMGPKPSKNSSIERVNNELGYSPDNCKWIDRFDQYSNTRRTHLLTFNGKTMHVSAWARELGINHTTIHARLKKGWPIERVFAK